MKRKFYEQLDVKIENKKSNNSFLNREKYELHFKRYLNWNEKTVEKNQKIISC